MDQWYFERDGSPAGPVSFDEIQRLAQTGVLARDTRVWSEGMSDWVAAGTIDRIWATSAPAAAAPPAPVAPAAPSYGGAPAYTPPAPAYTPPAPAYAAPQAAPLASAVGLRPAGHGMSMTTTVDLDKMIGDMRFVGIFTIIMGALTCLGIITAIVGVPVIIMGLRLREAADQFERYARAGDEVSLGAALEKQSSYFRIQKIFLMIYLGFIVLYVIGLMLFAGSMSSMLGGGY